MEDSNKSFLDQLGTDAKGLAVGGIASAATSYGANALSKLININTPQDYPIGELMSDYILDANNLRKGPNPVIFKQSVPRTASDLLDAAKGATFFDRLKYDLFSPILADNVRYDFKPDELGELKDIFRQTGEEAVTHEILGHSVPDKLSKVPGLLDSIRNGGGQSKLKELNALIEKEFLPPGTSSPANIITVPRNNTSIIGHEYGHLFEQMERNKFVQSGTPMWKKIKEAWDFIHTDVGVNPIDQSGVLPEKWHETLQGWRGELASTPKGKVLNALLDNIIGTPLTMVTTPLVSSKVVRDAIGSLDSSGTTQKVMDWIGDNNVAVSMMASAPSIIHEMSTIAPGYKNTVNFWKEFNKGEKGLLAGSELLKKSAPLVGKKKPWLEGLKYLGINALPIVASFAPVIGTAVGNVMGWNDDPSKGEDSI